MKDGNVVFDDTFKVSTAAHIQINVTGEEFKKYLNTFPMKEKVAVLKDGVIEVKDIEILGAVLNQLGKDEVISRLYMKDSSIQELFDRITRKVL